jgi:hypothetical protein
MNFDYSQWRMNRRVGVANRDMLQDALSAAWEQFWACRVRGNHQEKMGSHGRCYRCNKAMR